MKGCSIEQPVFAANYIKGTVSAEPGGRCFEFLHFKLVYGVNIDVLILIL